VAFVLLLLIATVATGLVWQNVAVARDGDAVARLVVFSAAPVAAVSVALLGRIVVKLSSARTGRGS